MVTICHKYYHDSVFQKKTTYDTEKAIADQAAADAAAAQAAASQYRR